MFENAKARKLRRVSRSSQVRWKGFDRFRAVVIECKLQHVELPREPYEEHSTSGTYSYSCATIGIDTWSSYFCPSGWAAGPCAPAELSLNQPAISLQQQPGFRLDWKEKIDIEKESWNFGPP